LPRTWDGFDLTYTHDLWHAAGLKARGYASAMAMRERKLLLLTALAVALVAPVGAQADSASSLEVVGSAEPLDAGLIRNVVQPAFEAAFPQYTLNYAGAAAKVAVTNAETGAGGPSVLLLDGPALESPFVAGGYSYNGQPGNAVFSEDFVLAGTTGDPAGVTANAPHDVAQAFAGVAAAGVAGTATVISRGGTITAPASTIEEHSIWNLVDKAGLTPAGVVLCTVSEADGGGMTPVNPNVQATSGMPCPDDGTVSTATPDWYEIKSTNEETEMTDANACVSTSNGATHCYVLTDRGTFDYLASGIGQQDAVPNMAILDRDNAASAAGGAEALVKYFHAYVINPAKPGETVNLQAAQDFIGLLTSPTLQSRVSSYLTEPGGGPFAATASPFVSASPSSASVDAGGTVSVTGGLFNAESGFPKLAGETVTVERVSSAGPQPVVSGLTNADGQYTLAFTPPVSGSYEVATGPISQVELAGLEPPFSDLLSPGVSAPFSETVNAASSVAKSTNVPAAIQTASKRVTVQFKRVTIRDGSLTVSGALSSAPKSRGSTVRLLVKKGAQLTSRGKTAAIGGKSHTFKVLASVPVKTGHKSFSVSHKLARGFHYSLRLEYVLDGKAVARSAIRKITIR
jgi:ABC-type tungstate transport system permease subunit